MTSQRLVTTPFVLVTTAVFMGALSPNTFLLASRYLAERGFDPADIGTVMSAFMVGSLCTMPAIGRIIQRGKRTLVLILGCLVGAAGCWMFELASGMSGYVGARLIQGCGFAAVLVSGSAYVAEVAPPARLAQALGFAGVMTLASQAAGPAVGEWIVAAASWDWLFRFAAIGGAAGALIAAFLPGLPARAAADPSPDGRPSARAAVAATALAGFGFGAVVGFIAAYADGAGLDQVKPFFIAYVIAAIGARLGLGHLADQYGRHATAVPALLGHAIGLAALAALSATWQLVAIGLLYGLSHGVYYPSLQALIVDRAPDDARSRAIAASTLSFGLGIFVAQLGLGFVARAAGYPAIYLASAGLGVAAAVVVWLDR